MWMSAERTECRLAAPMAARMRESRELITRRWLDRIAARVSIEPRRIFPSEELLDHVPLLIDGIAAYLEEPANDIAADPPVIDKAMELGELRHAQGFDAYEILKEYELLGMILFAFISEEIAHLDAEQTEPREILVCSQRLFRAISIIQQNTTTQFLRRAAGRVQEREDRLRAFNRALSHEMKNRIGAVLGAADLLTMVDELDEAQRSGFAKMIVRNAREMQATLANLLDLTRLETDARQHRHVDLAHAAAEVVRRLRDAAEAARVDVRLGELPPVEVNAAAVELVLTNYVSNAIKYTDRTKRERWVRIDAEVDSPTETAPGELVVRVRDNGLGVPPESRAHLFERFFRAHADVAPSVEGTGLGLNIVRETVESLGGRAWAEFPRDESVFAFAMPCRRAEDLAEAEAGTAEMNASPFHSDPRAAPPPV